MLRATGSTIKFSGFLAVYEEKEDREEEEKKDEDKMLPLLKEGQPLNLVDLNRCNRSHKPPPRFTEASLVKELEKSGIGRPSTYAAIMNKIQSRDYTIKEKGAETDRTRQSDRENARRQLQPHHGRHLHSRDGR